MCRYNYNIHIFFCTAINKEIIYRRQVKEKLIINAIVYAEVIVKEEIIYMREKKNCIHSRFPLISVFLSVT
jgi:hypothetical protein